jgi:hypothetical protein
MAIHDGTTVVGVTPRISVSRFADILRTRGSPAATESNPEDAWSAVKQHGVDPTFALAIFHQESQFGADPASATTRFTLRNPGHTRSSRTGVGTPVATDFGPFIRYPSWTEGWRDLAFRLVDERFDYVTRPPGAPHRTIRPILKIWAPPDDHFDTVGFNDHERYVRNVVQNMTDWIDLPGGGAPTTTSTTNGETVTCAPSPPPAFNGTNKQVGSVVFHAAAQTVEVDVAELRCRQFADPASCETREPLRRGDTFDTLYWVEGAEVDGERRWWVTSSGARVWSGGTRQKPGGA